MILNRKTIGWAAAAALTGILLVPSAFRNTKTYPTGCETYQGRRGGPDREIIYVFDEKTLEKRGNESINHTLLGNPEWKKELEIGRAYRLQINDRRLVSFQPCMDSEISNTK